VFDIIPDIHGQAGKLKAALTQLGYRKRKGAWRHSNPEQRCVFLGDFIDRGPENAEVISIVREMIDAGSALAVMGNHELNAIHYHTLNPEDGTPLRRRSVKNKSQHGSFLKEFPPADPETAEAVKWMRSLPLFLEVEGFRAVHACWNEATIEALRKISKEGVLSPEQLVRAAPKEDPIFNDPIFELVETTTKGPEVKLPKGFTFVDKNGDERSNVRLKWWVDNADSWAEVSMSVPDTDSLPKTDLPGDVVQAAYPSTAKPIFFGHYWLDGVPILQASNALCLDYSAGTKKGPIVSYRFSGDVPKLDVAKISVHSS
jgi:hypothetical protein